MDNLGKKVGYLAGLLEGADFSDAASNKRLFGLVVELLGGVVERVESVDEMLAELNDYVESIDDDLVELEGMHDDDDEDFLPFDFDGDDDELSFAPRKEPVRLFNPRSRNDDSVVELVGGMCPECKHMFFVENSLSEIDDNAKYVCPHCESAIPLVPLTPENTPIAKPYEE